MSRKSYKAGLRSAVRGLWNGALDSSQFAGEMRRIVNLRLTQAWNKGAEGCGIKPDELTNAELLALGQAVQQELTFVDGLSSAIEEGSKKNGGKLRPLFVRVDKWLNRYDELEIRARTMACKDQKGIWIMDASKENCRSCSKLNGKVKRMSFWTSSGILPRRAGAGYLECKGYFCGCSINVTSAPISRGPLPGLP